MSIIPKIRGLSYLPMGNEACLYPFSSSLSIFQSLVTCGTKERLHVFFLQEESKTLECNACKAVIRCVESCQLVSVFNIDHLKKKAARMDREKADRKRLGSGNRFQNKRARGAAGPQSFPASKSARASGSGSGYGPSFQNPVSRSFGYAARAGYVNPAAAAQPYYAPGSMAARRGGVLYGGPGAAFGAQQPYHR